MCGWRPRTSRTPVWSRKRVCRRAKCVPRAASGRQPDGQSPTPKAQAKGPLPRIGKGDRRCGGMRVRRAAWRECRDLPVGGIPCLLWLRSVMTRAGWAARGSDRDCSDCRSNRRRRRDDRGKTHRSTGIAKPRPSPKVIFMLVMPTTSPRMLKSGPPLLPGLICAVVCR